MNTITAKGVAATLNDVRHLGYGYACTRSYELPAAQVADLDAAVAAVANELDLTYEQLFHWTNSKHGRWLTDEVHGCGQAATAATVRKHMTAAKVAEVQDA